MKLHFLGGDRPLRPGTVCAVRAHVFVSLVRTSDTKATSLGWSFKHPINTLVGGGSSGAKGGVHTFQATGVSKNDFFTL